MPYSNFTIRRIRNILVTSLLAVALWIWVSNYRSNLQDVSIFTGYLLAALIVFLAAYNVRKKLVLFPLGTSAGWLQFHIYIGLLTPVILGLHVNWRIPQGQFELFLFFVYVSTVISGVYGLYLTRTLPHMLTRLSEELIYERYPALFQQVRTEAESLISAAGNSSETLSELYLKKLHYYFVTTRSLFYYLWPTTKQRRQLLNAIQGAKRYAAIKEQDVLSRLEQLVSRRDDLDFQHALQWKLRGWLFVHLGLTYSLLLLIAAHLVLVQVFREGF